MTNTAEYRDIETKFAEHQLKVKQQARESAAEKLVPYKPIYQVEEEAKKAALQIVAREHKSDRRNWFNIDGENETTKLLFWIFTAAQTPNSQVSFDNYRITAKDKLSSEDEDLLLLFLTKSSRIRTIDGGTKFVISVSEILKQRGIDPNQSKNRRDVVKSLERLFSFRAFVLDVRTGWEDYVHFFKSRTPSTKVVEMKPTDFLMSQFDEPAFTALLDTDLRKKAETKDSVRLGMWLQWSKTFRYGGKIIVPREQLMYEIGCRRLGQWSPREFLTSLAHDLSYINIRMYWSTDFDSYTFQKMSEASTQLHSKI